MDSLLVSIVVCAHRSDRFDDLLDAVESLKAQSYRRLDIVIVIDGNPLLFEKIMKSKSDERTQVILNEKNLGLSESRNVGVLKARGDIIAFFDDDALADEKWVEELVKMYEERGAIAAGGRILPFWLSHEPKCLPQEFYWLIGATHKGFPEEVAEVRNTFGSNLSFKADVLRALGGFRGEMGIKGRGLRQSEETEICERMKKMYGKGVYYNNKAIVHHKVFPERQKAKFLLRRAFWHGYSKRVMEELGYSLSEEGKFLQVLGEGIIGRVTACSFKALCQLAFLLALTTTVGLGYLSRALTSSFRS